MKFQFSREKILTQEFPLETEADTW